LATSENPTNKRKRRKRLGELPPLTDEQLEALAAVTPQDIEAAAALWRATAPKRYKKLLDATEKDDPIIDPNA